MRMGWFSIVFLGGNPLLFLILLFLFSIIVLLYYRRIRPNREGGKGRALLLGLLPFLRTSSLSLLLFLVFQPLLHLFLPKHESPLYPILIDISRSMSLPAGEGFTRIEEVERLLEQEPFRELNRKGESPIWVFSKVPERWTEDSLTLEGNVTDIGSAIEGVQKASGRKISALILFSDGGHNLGVDPLRIAREVGFPIYPVEIGKSPLQGDISLERIRVNDVVYAGDRVPVEVLVETMGLGGEEAEIRLVEKERILAKGRIILTEEKMKQTKILHFVPETPGFHSLKVEIEPLRGEISSENNSRTFACEVLKGKLKPLILAGRPSWNLSFLKNSFLRNEMLDPDLYIFLKEGVYLYQSEEGGRWKEEVISSFPLFSPNFLNEYDFFVLLEIGTEASHEEFLSSPFPNLLEKAVSGGKGVLFLGSSFTSQMELNRLLPVILSPGLPSRMDKEMLLELTEEGRSHPLMLLGEDPLQNEKIWKNFPPFDSGDRVLGSKSGASVLAVYSESKTPQGKMPALAIQRFGEGRVVWIGAREFWRLGFLPLGMEKNSQMEGIEGNVVFDQFLGNLFRWLVLREGKGRLRIATDKRVYSSGEPIQFEASLYNESLESLDGAIVSVKIQSGVPTPLHLFNVGKGRYRGRLNALPPGQYSFVASAQWSGNEMDRKEGEFLVEDLSLEFFDLEINSDLLKKIAEVSGGQVISQRDLPRGLEGISPKGEAVQFSKEFNLANLPYLYLLLLVSLALEWSIRRRHGMP